VPVISGTAPDENGSSYIVLAAPWSGVNVSNTQCFVFPTFQNIEKTVESMNALNSVSRGILTRLKELVASQSPTLDIKVGATATITTTPFGYLAKEMQSSIDELNSKLGAVCAMTKPEFDSLSKNELKHHNITGVLNSNFDTSFIFAQTDGWQNKFKLAANSVKIDGIWHDYDEQTITLAPAPNGLQNIDLSQPDYPDLASAIVAGGTSLSASNLNQRELVMAVQSDEVLQGANAQNTAYIQDSANHVYSDNGVLRQRLLSFVAERLPESVPVASKANHWTNTVNAMQALGWTKDADILGQWTKGDLKATAIAWVQRENQGTGHPMNPQGCGAGVNVGASNWVRWSDNTSRKPSTISDCFEQYVNTVGLTSGPVGDDSGFIGSIAGGGAHLGNWNNEAKFFDAIYPDQVINLTIDANSHDNASVLNTYSNASVSAELQGHESVPFTRILTTTSGANASTSTIFTTTTGIFVGDIVYIEHSAGTYQRRKVDTVTATYIVVDDTVDRKGLGYIVHESQRSKYTSSDPTWTSILGSPANLKATLDNLGVDGIYGTWIPVVPNGTLQEFPFARKNTTNSIDAPYTSNNGLTWAVALDYIGGISSSSNSRTESLHGNSVEFWHYKTKAYFTEESVNRKIDLFGNVFATNWNDNRYGNSLASSLIGKVGTNNNQFIVNAILPLTSMGTLNPITGAIDAAAYAYPTHSTINLVGTGPAVKVLRTLCEVGGFKAIQFTFKEMAYDSDMDNGNDFEDKTGSSTVLTIVGNYYHVTSGVRTGYWKCLLAANAPFDDTSWNEYNGVLHYSDGQKYFERWDGNGWGDDNKFQVVDGMSSVSDDNGNSVIIGTHTYVTNIKA